MNTSTATAKETEPLSPDTHKTNEVENSCINLECDQIEFNIYFDGTWNSKENSDWYNNPNLVNEDGTLSEEKMYGDRALEERTDRKYNPGKGSISFARAPTGVDQMHRATDAKNPHVIKLYIDGAGAVTPQQENGQKVYTKDDPIGAGSGWGATGVYTKMRTMFKQIQSALELYAEDGHKLPKIMTFNVYGFSRGAATARMFCNRIIKKKNDITEVLHYVNLQQFDVVLKFVGLFDTVSSIGFSHTNDVKGDEQDLDFDEHQVKKIVHIVAMHEYRQKFNITNIAVPVSKGYGFEFALPGCHTDIGDGLGTEGNVLENRVFDEDMQLPINQDKWYVTDRDENAVAILQRRVEYEANPEHSTFSLWPIPVFNAESKARQSNRYADYDIVRTKLIDEGWFLDNEISEFKNEKYERLEVYRKQISPDYPKIPTHIMIELIKKNNAYFFKPAHLKLYSIENVVEPAGFAQMYENLKNQVMQLDDVKTKNALTGQLRNDNITNQPRIDIIGNETLRKLMYNRCLHWCSSMDGNPVLKVNVGQIDHTNNIFYRTIVSG